MTRRKVKASTLRARMLQKRGLIDETIKAQEPERPGTRSARFRQKAASVRNAKLKTPRMLLKEIEFNMEIEDILAFGPLHHNNALTRCRRCIQCCYGIDFTTASKWRKRLGIPRYKAVV